MKKGSESGVTMLELMVALVIVGLLAAIAVPSSRGMIKTMRMWGAANIVKQNLLMARSKAMADPSWHCGVYFRLSPADSHSVLVFVERVTNNNQFDDPRTGGNDRIYQPETFIDKDVSMSWSVGKSAPNNVIVFRGDGSAKFPAGEMTLSDGKNFRKINVLASTGRIRVRNQ